MRILLITHFFPPTRNAGTENYTLGLAKSFLERGHRVDVVCSGTWQLGQDYWNGLSQKSYFEIPVHRLNLNWKKANDPNRVLYDSEPVEKWLNSFLDANKPDLVHVTSTMTLGVGTLRAVREAGIPLVLTLMDFWFLCPRTVLVRGNGELCDGATTPWECQHCMLTSSSLYQHTQFAMPARFIPILWNKISKTPSLARRRDFRGHALNMENRKSIMQEAIELPDIILAHSQFVERTFLSAGLSHRVIHLPNGHDLSWLQEYRGKNKSTHLRFGYMGQVLDLKGIHVLIEAFKSADLNGRATLNIWGDLSNNDQYSRQLLDLIGNLSSIKLRGRFERRQLAEVLADIDVLVVPSLWYENAPLVIYEAFATKTPVIATNLGGMAEAVAHDISGLLFERSNAEDLAKQMKRFLDEPALLERLKAGIPAVRTILEEVTELESIYQELIGEKSD